MSMRSHFNPGRRPAALPRIAGRSGQPGAPGGQGTSAAAPAERSGWKRLVAWLGGTRQQARVHPAPTSQQPAGIRRAGVAAAARSTRFISSLQDGAGRGASTLSQKLQEVLTNLQGDGAPGSITDKFKVLLATGVAQLTEADAAKFLLDLMAAKSEPIREEDQPAVEIMLRTVEQRLTRRGADRRLAAQVAALPPERFPKFLGSLNLARSHLAGCTERRALTGLVAKIEAATSARTTVKAFVKANMTEQSAMSLDTAQVEQVTVEDPSGLRLTVPVFAEFAKDIGRASHSIVTASGEQQRLIPAADIRRFGDESFKAQSKAKALQTIFTELAGGNIKQFQEISRWCQQGAFGFVDKAAATRNSPFKLPDGTPVCLPKREYDVTYQLERHDKDVLVTSTIVYRVDTFAAYYENMLPDKHRPAAAGSQCGVTQTFRIDVNGQVTLEKPPTTWDILAPAVAP